VTVELTDTGRALRERAQCVPDGVMQRLGVDMSELTALHDKLLTLIAAATQAPS
jgi:MarR family transcriptional regulator, organic hydroperoxide resistance regulator